MIKNATKHYAEKNIFSLILKKFKWGKTYFKPGTKRFNYFPQDKKEIFPFIKNFLFNLTIIPNFYYSIKVYANRKDFVSFLFPFVAFFNTLAYGVYFLRSRFNRIFRI